MGQDMTRLTRILMLVGLLAAGVAFFMLGLGERPIAQENPAASTGAQRAGRSTLSHGGPGAGSPPGQPERLPASDRNDVFNQSPSATTR